MIHRLIRVAIAPELAWLLLFLYLGSYNTSGTALAHLQSRIRRLETEIPIQTGTFACKEGRDLAKAVLNETFNVAVVTTSISISKADWSVDTSLPITLSRPFTILGLYEDRHRWPVVDLLNASSLIHMVPGGSLNISRVVIKNWRNNAPYFRAPGMDIFWSSTVNGSGRSGTVGGSSNDSSTGLTGSFAPSRRTDSPPAVAVAASIPGAPSVIIWRAILIHRICIPYPIFKQYMSSLSRPPELQPGNQSTSNLTQPADCINRGSSSGKSSSSSSGGDTDAAVGEVDFCFDARYLNHDVGLYAVDLGLSDITMPADYIAWIYETQSLCEVVMPESCIREHGTPMGCYTFMTKRQPARAESITAGVESHRHHTFLVPLIVGLIGGFVLLAVGVVLLLAWTRTRWMRRWTEWRLRSESSGIAEEQQGWKPEDHQGDEEERDAAGGSHLSSTSVAATATLTMATRTATSTPTGTENMLSISYQQQKLAPVQRDSEEQAGLMVPAAIPAVAVAVAPFPCRATPDDTVGRTAEAVTATAAAMGCEARPHGVCPDRHLRPDSASAAGGTGPVSITLEVSREEMSSGDDRRGHVGHVAHVGLPVPEAAAGTRLPSRYQALKLEAAGALGLANESTPPLAALSIFLPFQATESISLPPCPPPPPSASPSALVCLAPEVALDPVTYVTPLRPGLRLEGSRMVPEVTLLPVTLGKGAFGRVVEGMYGGERVAVKLLNTGLLAGVTAGDLADEAVVQPMPASVHGGVVGPAAADMGVCSRDDGIAAAVAVTDTAVGEAAEAGLVASAADIAATAVAAAGGVAAAATPAAGCSAEGAAAAAPAGLMAGDMDLPAPQRGRGNIAWRGLVQEVEVLGRCQHPNIVKLLAASLMPPRVCLVMELMDTSLERLMYSTGSKPLALQTVLHIGIQIARALSYLHPTILHRDLKPANVLISDPTSTKPIAKLADFGLSRLHETVLVTRHPEVGTVPYMAPELFDLYNMTITDRTDIYALGVLLWEMLACKRPWAGYTAVQVAFILAVLRERLPLHDLPYERCPPKLRSLILSCWESDPARRPAAAEVVKALALVQEVGASAAIRASERANQLYRMELNGRQRELESPPRLIASQYLLIWSNTPSAYRCLLIFDMLIGLRNGGGPDSCGPSWVRRGKGAWRTRLIPPRGIVSGSSVVHLVSSSKRKLVPHFCEG
ncbi:hypothetical protein VaNZ11_006541 [Volvox africanus]|uniref:Protein kinase domain-containing protein n=1 Tax=Volvox africanus TaxID=51714 RepID=A0ABQ5S2Q1_9CHLO|nr:hypothetical protein VaNZ11_006541 [Volvox africanus]